MEFSELAIQKLLQLFPELSSLIVTFKDITDETASLEETDISIGVFILQVNGKFFYLPIIAKGEAIQPLDSIFDNEEQVFTPLTKGFVTRMVNSQQSEMGKPTKIPQTVSQNPSIYSLVTPPRTGKFVYASSSKLEEFLSILPNMVKQAVLDKFSSDKDTYSALHKLFGLDNIVSALKPTAAPVIVQPKAAIELITGGSGLGNKEIQDILEHGYSLRGENQTTRIAVRANDAAAMGKYHELSSGPDAGKDFDVCLTSGVSRPGFIPKHAKYLPKKAVLLQSRNTIEQIPIIFENGDFTIAKQAVAAGQGRDGMDVLKMFFEVSPPITPSGLSNQSYFALFSPELEVIGIYDYPRVTKTNHGVTIVADNLLQTDGSRVTINAYKNCELVDCSDTNNIFVPYNTLVAILGKRLWDDELEVNINAAADRDRKSTMMALGSAVDIGHDGVEFIVNRNPVGSEANIMRFLVVEEGLAPEQAESFIKQAKEQKHVKIYMSKKADAEQDIIPSYGDSAPQQQPGFGINDDFTNNVNQSIQTNDPEVVESTIISELLQVADMKSYIKEYLPEIKNSIDKLGRALFLCRLKMDQLALDHTASEVFSFISGLRNTYRNLGDTYLKLESMISDSEIQAEEKQG
jgi:hypothetical protein